MNHAGFATHGVAPVGLHIAPTGATIRDFRERLDAMVTRSDPEEATLDILLDFFGSRCDSVDELKSLGETLFTTLSRSAPQAIVTGRYRERFLFDRRGNCARVHADGLLLATLHLDEAIRMATLLHGAAQTLANSQHAA
jgi:hypothetical protein